MAGGVGEVALILGLIASIIDIAEKTKNIYDGAHDKTGLPKAFREVDSKLPLVVSILHEAKKQNEHTQQFKTEIEPLLRSCEDDTADLRTIFSKVIPPDNAPWYERYSKAARAVKPGRTRKVESLMADILKNLQLLESHHLFKNVITSKELQNALQDILKIEKEDPSLPDDPNVTIYSTGQGSNFNTGPGTQKNQQTFGAGATWNIENYHAAQVDSLSPRNPTLHDKCVLLPYETVAAYSPRPALSRSLNDKLRAPYRGPSLAHAVVVTGLGGTGKTQLVLDHVEKHKDEYDTVVWLNASSEQNLRSSFAGCCEELYLKAPTWPSSSSRLEDEASVRAALQWFRGRGENQNWLVVLDNADDASQCPYDIVPKGPSGSLIITSRDRRASRLVNEKGESMEVDAMETYEAVSLLLLSAGISEHKIQGRGQGLSERIVNDLDRLPLAVSLAGAAISDELLLDDDVEAILQSYRLDLRQHRDQLLKTENSAGLSSYDKTISTVWSSTFSAIEKSYEDVPAMQLLTFLTYLDRSFIPHELFRVSAIEYSRRVSLEEVSIPEWLQSLLTLRGTKNDWDDHQYRKTIKPLLRYGLVRSVNGPAGMKGLTMHGLVRWRAKQQPEYECYEKIYLVWMYLALRHEALFTEARPFQWIIPHLPRAKRLVDNFDLPTNTMLCEVLRVFAEAWKSARSWRRAERIYTKLFRIARVAEEMDSNLRADLKRICRHEIGEIQFHRKFRDKEDARGSDIKHQTEAAALIEKIFESESLELGEEHIMTLSTGTNLVGVYFWQGRESTASELSSKLLQAQQRVLGPKHPQTLMCTLNAASKRSDPAELLMTEIMQTDVLKTATEELGEAHPVTIAAVEHLAGTHMQAELLGEAHPDTLTAMGKLAAVFEAEGLTLEAARMRSRADALWTKRLSRKTRKLMRKLAIQDDASSASTKILRSTLWSELLFGDEQNLSAISPDRRAISADYSAMRAMASEDVVGPIESTPVYNL